MNVSRIGFSGNYCIKTNSIQANAEMLHSGLVSAVNRGEKICVSRRNDDVYLTTNHSQYSADDLMLMRRGLENANAMYKNRNPRMNSPFDKEGLISLKIEKAFQIDARERGTID